MSEKKEPPSDDRDVFAVCVDGAVRIAAFVGGKWKQEVGPYEWEPICSDVVDWCDVPEWPDLVAAPGEAARLADAQARLDKAQARILELEAVNSRLTKEIVDVEKRAERAEKERDEAVEWRREVAEALDVIKDNGVIADVDYAVRHARALRHVADQRHDAMARADQAIRERDEVGCQLEALRAVQRDDLQVLVARIALVEADVAGLKRLADDTDAGLEGLVFEGQKGGECWRRGAAKRCSAGDGRTERAPERPG